MQQDLLWEEGVDVVQEGDVKTWDGRPVSLCSLIQRRWGWPKKAANAAADYLRAHKVDGVTRATLWINNPWRREQQDHLFKVVPGLVADLCSGLARGSSKEALDADHMVYGIEVTFDRPISDDGLVREVTCVLANRLGAAPDDVRKETHYDTGSAMVAMRVRTSAFRRAGSDE